MNGPKDFRLYFLLFFFFSLSFSPFLPFPSLLFPSSLLFFLPIQASLRARADSQNENEKQTKKYKNITMTSDTTLFSGMYILLYLYLYL